MNMTPQKAIETFYRTLRTSLVARKLWRMCREESTE
jgi:hypothetical protein